MASFVLFMAVTVTIAAVICAYIFILPDKRYASLPGFFKVVADFLNGKKLWLESALKLIYIAGTAFYIVFSSFSALVALFKGYPGEFLGMLVTGIVGVVVIRLLYEGITLGIMLVKNVIQINNRLRDKDIKETEDATEFQDI